MSSVAASPVVSHQRAEQERITAAAGFAHQTAWIRREVESDSIAMMIMLCELARALSSFSRRYEEGSEGDESIGSDEGVTRTRRKRIKGSTLGRQHLRQAPRKRVQEFVLKALCVLGSTYPTHHWRLTEYTEELLPQLIRDRGFRQARYIVTEALEVLFGLVNQSRFEGPDEDEEVDEASEFDKKRGPLERAVSQYRNLLDAGARQPRKSGPEEQQAPLGGQDQSCSGWTGSSPRPLAEPGTTPQGHAAGPEQSEDLGPATAGTATRPPPPLLHPPPGPGAREPAAEAATGRGDCLSGIPSLEQKLDVGSVLKLEILRALGARYLAEPSGALPPTTEGSRSADLSLRTLYALTLEVHTKAAATYHRAIERLESSLRRNPSPEPWTRKPRPTQLEAREGQGAG